MRVLCIGGPVDGQYFDLKEGLPTFKVVNIKQCSITQFTSDAPNFDETIETEIYFRKELVGVAIYIHSSLSYAETMVKLVQGYNPK